MFGGASCHDVRPTTTSQGRIAPAGSTEGAVFAKDNCSSVSVWCESGRASDESGLVCRVRLRVCDLVQGKTMDNVPVLVVDSLVDVVFFVDILLNFHLTFVGSATPPCRSAVTAVRCDRGIVVVSRQCRAGVTEAGVTAPVSRRCHGGVCHGAGVMEVALSSSARPVRWCRSHVSSA